MTDGDSFKDEAARLGPTYQRNLEELRRQGFLRRRRLRGDYKITAKGGLYLRDVCQRHDDVREWLSQFAERWESGAMTEVERDMSQIELIFYGLSKDLAGETEALSHLRAQGFDPVAALREAGYSYTPPDETE